MNKPSIFAAAALMISGAAGGTFLAYPRVRAEAAGRGSARSQGPQPEGSATRDTQDSANSNRHTNRLIHEKSPYLLLHAHNPVDWYPWGAEAFEKARKENKPIFLSIGYFTCHWCHVMERE